MCIFNNAPAQYHADLLNAVTGRQETLDSLLHIGERIWNLKRAYNNRLGLTRAHDRLPKLLLQPLAEGGAQGHEDRCSRCDHSHGPTPAPLLR